VRHTGRADAAGKIGGVRDHGVHVFKGVPYGADSATRRFLPPIAATRGKRVRDALDYGPACPQPDAKEAVSEDCLSLNVWTPALRDGGKRPSWSTFTAVNTAAARVPARSTMARALCCAVTLSSSLRTIA
jgi:hypothetical protein